MRREESLGNSLTPSNGTYQANSIPWYIDKNNENVDLYGSRRSRISQKSLNPAWQQQPQLVENMSQRVTPEFFDNVRKLYERLMYNCISQNKICYTLVSILVFHQTK